jgi:hypothetical protein
LKTLLYASRQDAETINSDGAHDPLTPPVLHGAGGFFLEQRMKTTHAQVTQVVAYRTNDGQLFNSAQEANAHAASISFLNWYRHGNEIHGAQTGDPVDGRDLAEWLTDNRTAVLAFLLTQTEE